MDAAPLFWRRIGAILVDAAVLAAAFVATVYAAATVAPHGGAPFLPFWEDRPPVQVIAEPVGTPRTEKIEGGIVRTLAHRRETRLFADGSVAIYAVLEAHTRTADGTVYEGTAEALVGENRFAVLRRWMTLGLAVLLPMLYFTAFEASAWRGSPGKLVLGLAVTDLDGRRLGLRRALARQALKLLDVATSMVTFLIAAFTERGQAIHDRLAGTLVVRRPSC